MNVLQQIDKLRKELKIHRLQGKTIGFVPTMGNLHQGHLNLVREAKQRCEIVVVSIFVNPTQFGEGEDYQSYPRTLEQDCDLLRAVGCDIVFAPNVDEMYGSSVRLTSVSVSQITQKLCGASRPGHFDGVALVVSKLFNIVQPEFAFFGEKDFQQLAVIRQLVKDLNFDIEIIGVPIARAEDGLALSSRNGYLTDEQRRIAPEIYRSLKMAAQKIKQGDNFEQVKLWIIETLTHNGFDTDYVEILTPDLTEIPAFTQDVVIFIAAKLGKPRLIDNLYIRYDA